jgi:hypothetical protein
VYPGAPVTDGNGIDDDCSEYRSGVEASENLSLSEMEEDIANSLKLDVYPNPSAAYFTLRISGVYGKPVQLSVTDIAGMVLETKGNIASNTTTTIGHRYLPGVYFVTAIQEGKKVVIKCIKQ